MKIRISKFLSFIALLLVTVIFFASCDAFQGAISSGALNQKKLFDGKTPKDLYGSSINKYKNKGNGLIYCVEIEWSKSETSNDSANVKLVYSDDDLYYTSIVSSVDNQEIEAITLKGNKMYYLTKNGSKHLYSSNHDDVLSYIENYTKVKEVHQAFPDNLPNSWFDNLEFNLTEDGSYAVGIDVDEKKSKDHPKYSNFYQPGCKCNLYFDDKGDLNKIALKNVNIDGVNNDVVINLSWGDSLKIEEPSDKDNYVDKGVFDSDKLNDSDEDNDDNTNLHTHSYSAVMKREPTCTVQGYTIYSCDCSDTYVGDYVDAHGHNYVNNTCTYCGETLKVSEGLSYVLSDDETHYMVSGIGSCMDTDIVIPEEHNGLPVSAVADFAFRECSTIKSVVIPNSILSIGWYGFYGCENLESVIIGDSVTLIGDIAFARCEKLTNISVDKNNQNYKSLYGDLYTKDGKTFIQYAIGKQNAEFILPDAVDTICLLAFAECDYLTSVKLSNTVKNISYGLFLSCDNLINVNLPEKITSIAYEMFYGTSLVNITIPQGVTKIEGDGFGHCTKLESIVIPVSVETIGECAFSSCDSLISVYYGGTESDWESIHIDELANDDLIFATRYYYSETQPTTNGNFWHYVEGVPTVWQEYLAPVYSGGLEFISRGNGTCFVRGIGTCKDTYLVIPPVSPDGDIVTSIEEFAFDNCEQLTRVAIANSVKSIGEGAFSSCLALTTIEIPDSVTSIGNYALSCHALTSICVEEGNSAFKSIDGNLYSKDGKTLIQYAIGKKDTSFTIPDSVTRIGNYAFSSCTSLTSIVIPDSVIRIGDDAFSRCTSLTSLRIGNSVTSIGDLAFLLCTALTSIYVNEENNSYKSIDGNLYSKDGKTLIQYAMGKKETSFVISNSVTSIGNHAFACCDFFISILIPDSVTSIGEEAFSSCTSLTSIVIPDSVLGIDLGAFSSCSGLTSVTIPKSIRKIYMGAFYGCYALTNVYYTGSEEEWNAISIESRNKDLTNATRYYYSENPPTTEGNFWHYVEGVVTVWPPYAEEHKHSYSKVITEATCTARGYTTYTCDCKESYIDDYTDAKGHAYVNYVCIVCNHYYYSEGLAFRSNGDGTCSVGLGDVENLDPNVVIPSVSPAGDSVTEISSYAFFECFEITKLFIPDSVITIGTCAFASCAALEEAIIGSNVTNIGEEAFFACYNLAKITIGDGTMVIGDRMFANCSSLVDIIIPESVTKIGYSAFSGCTSLTAITIPGSVKTVDFDAFYNCSSLTDVIICDGVEIIGESMFSSCTALENIIIPDSVASISDFAFRNCTALKNVYYTGSEKEWDKISIDHTNSNLTNATIHYNYVPEE